MKKNAYEKTMVLEPRNKLNEKQSTIATHKAVGYCPMIDWKKIKKNIT